MGVGLSRCTINIRVYFRAYFNVQHISLNEFIFQYFYCKISTFSFLFSNVFCTIFDSISNKYTLEGVIWFCWERLYNHVYIAIGPTPPPSKRDPTTNTNKNLAGNGTCH